MRAKLRQVKQQLRERMHDPVSQTGQWGFHRSYVRSKRAGRREPSYDTCRWTGKQIHDFVPVLSKAMGSSPVRNQPFALNGITSERSKVTPWVTSASASLASQTPLALNSNGTIFTYTIPGNSVVTFEGKGD